MTPESLQMGHGAGFISLTKLPSVSISCSGASMTYLRPVPLHIEHGRIVKKRLKRISSFPVPLHVRHFSSRVRSRSCGPMDAISSASVMAVMSVGSVMGIPSMEFRR